MSPEEVDTERMNGYWKLRQRLLDGIGLTREERREMHATAKMWIRYYRCFDLTAEVRKIQWDLAQLEKRTTTQRATSAGRGPGQKSDVLLGGLI